VRAAPARKPPGSRLIPEIRALGRPRVRRHKDRAKRGAGRAPLDNRTKDTAGRSIPEAAIRSAAPAAALGRTERRPQEGEKAAATRSFRGLAVTAERNDGESTRSNVPARRHFPARPAGYYSCARAKPVPLASLPDRFKSNNLRRPGPDLFRSKGRLSVWKACNDVTHGPNLRNWGLREGNPSALSPEKGYTIPTPDPRGKLFPGDSPPAKDIRGGGPRPAPARPPASPCRSCKPGLAAPCEHARPGARAATPGGRALI